MPSPVAFYRRWRDRIVGRYRHVEIVMARRAKAVLYGARPDAAPHQPLMGVLSNRGEAEESAKFEASGFFDTTPSPMPDRRYLLPETNWAWLGWLACRNETLLEAERQRKRRTK